MPLRISFFKTPKHKVFNYTPLYWNPEKEAMEARLGKTRQRLMPGFFQDVRQQGRRRNKIGVFGRIIFIATMAALLFAAFYFSKFIEIVLQKVN
jgi:hypothetical protein